LGKELRSTLPSGVMTTTSALGSSVIDQLGRWTR
jgi:hypothetical protein